MRTVFIILQCLLRAAFSHDVCSTVRVVRNTILMIVNSMSTASFVLPFHGAISIADPRSAIKSFTVLSTFHCSVRHPASFGP